MIQKRNEKKTGICLSRKAGESITIQIGGETAEIFVHKITSGRVKLYCEAPERVRFVRRS